MATIDVKRPHSKSKDDAKKLAEEFAKDMQSKFNLDWTWTGDNITFNATSGAAKGTKGQVSVTDTEVRVEIDLPFMLKMLSGTIESKVKEKLEKLL